LDLGVEVGRGVEVGVVLGVAVGLAVAVAVGVGGGCSLKGTATPTVMGEPVLKNPTVAFRILFGPKTESNRKLYCVPQRIALAFWFCANVSVLQVIELVSCVTSHGVLL